MSIPRSYRFRSIPVLVLLVWNGVSGCTKSDDAVLARIGTRDVPAAEIRSVLNGLDPASKTRLAADQALLEQTVRNYLDQAAVVSEARKQGWDKKPEVQAAIAAAEREILVRGFVASVSQPANDYPSVADMQAVYDKNTGSFVTPKQFRLAQIFIAVPADADSGVVVTAREQAAALAQKARQKDADFAALARSYSQNAATAANGGDSGLVPESQLLPEVRQILPTLALNEVSNPVRSAAGFHVVKLLEVKSAEVESFEVAQPQIRALMRQKKQEELARNWLVEFRKNQSVTVNGIALAKLLGSSGEVAGK